MDNELSTKRSRRRSSRRRREGRESGLPESSRDKQRGTRRSGQGEARNQALSTFFLWAGRLIVTLMVLISPWWYASVSQQARLVLTGLAVSGLIMWWFSMAIGNRTRQIFPYLAFPVILGVILVGGQMIPLNETVGKILAPHQAELYATYASPADGELLEDPAVENTASVRITMDLDGTTRMFNLLILALICLLLGCHFFSSRKAIYYLPLVATINGVAIACFGIAQKLRTDTEIFGIALAQGGMAFGPFVNKNNAAGYLLICFACSLAVTSGAFRRKNQSGQRPRQIITNEYPIWQRISLHMGLFLAELNAVKIAAMLATLAIAAAIISTMSRGGILGFGIGMICVTWYYCLTRKTTGIVPALMVSAILMCGFVLWTGFGDRLADRFDVLSDVDLLEKDARINHWLETSGAIGDFMPLGSGVGSYLNVHRLYRIDNETALYYFAENQYFQTLVEAGIPGFVLLLTAMVLLGLCIRFIHLRGNSPKTNALCLLGVFLITSQSVAAFFDFGLFIPANVVLMAVISGFLAGQAHALADRLKKKYIFRFDIPRGLSMLMLLALFAASLLALISTYRYWRVDSALSTSPYQEDYRTLDLKQTDARIEDLRSELRVLPDADGLRRLAELYVYRYRIRLFDLLTASSPLIDSSEPDVLDRIWMQTSLDQLHAMIYREWLAGNEDRVMRLIRDPDQLVRDNLLKAIFYLKMSRARSPLQPDNHRLLGQLHCVSPTRNADQTHLQRSLQLAPGNAFTFFVCGLLDLQAGRIDSSCQRLRTCLEIDPRRYNEVVRIAVAFLPSERVVDEGNGVLPNDPIMLFNFAKTYLTLNSSKDLKLEVFRRVADLLDETVRDDRRYLVAKATVQEELGDLPAAIDTTKLLVDLNPDIMSLRFGLANLYIKNEQLRKAEEIAEYLVARESDNIHYERLLNRIRKLLIR